MAHQHLNLREIGDLLRRGFMSVGALKTYTSHVRCAEYPDAERFRSERADIERRWPAYAEDTTLQGPPTFVWDSLPQAMASCQNKAEAAQHVSQSQLPQLHALPDAAREGARRADSSSASVPHRYSPPRSWRIDEVVVTFLMNST